MVLVDAGGEYMGADDLALFLSLNLKSLLGYGTDITRTFPASGRFSEEQLVVYNMVLTAQMAGARTDDWSITDLEF